MGNKKDSDLASSRLRHIAGHIAGSFSEEMVRLSISDLLEGRGSEKGCLQTLEMHAHARAIYAWFAEEDLPSAKSWFWTSSLIKRRRLNLIGPGLLAGAISTFDSLDVVCMDDLSLAEELGAAFEILHRDAARGDPLAFISQQVGLVLQGRLQEASSLSDQFWASRGEDISNLFLGPDLLVLRNMHEGTDEDLVASIEGLCAVSSNARRRKLEDGFTESLISTPATIYMRLCWLAGREVEVQDALLPMQWMPSAPLGTHVLGFPGLEMYLLHGS